MGGVEREGERDVAACACAWTHGNFGGGILKRSYFMWNTNNRRCGSDGFKAKHK